ncbi:MAG: nickel pincer cofactor biosynthesis protein LarB [Phycisphaera sp.]|nr:nickel pincer cofactor biosynthesis protein LarB [Phycisphaera sp.]
MQDDLKQILERLAAGDIDVDAADAALRELHLQPLGFATIDHHRDKRCGVPEVIYAAGKTPEQVVAIARTLVDRSGHALVTRADATQAAAVRGAFDAVVTDERNRTLLVGSAPELTGTPIPIITAGTSDQPVADEAELTCRALGQPVHRISDVGVAGLARLIARLDEMQNTGVIICIAGMEGALPSVVGGLVSVPVVAVPTSVGYGAAFGGITALLGMLTSCAAGVTVVNIDNGFGAAYNATLIQRLYDRADHD